MHQPTQLTQGPCRGGAWPGLACEGGCDGRLLLPAASMGAGTAVAEAAKAAGAAAKADGRRG